MYVAWKYILIVVMAGDWGAEARREMKWGLEALPRRNHFKGFLNRKFRVEGVVTSQSLRGERQWKLRIEP